MDTENGGQNSLERQRLTAAEIARQKVLEAYTNQNQNQANIKNSFGSNRGNTITASEWQKYHSAWQNYYQKYYNDYYANAAQKYIETEKLKQFREQEDDRKSLQDLNLNRNEVYNATAKTLRERISASAINRAKRDRKSKHLIPILAGVSVFLIFMFLQYNRLIFAPIIAYVSPGNASVDSIAELDATVMKAPGPEPKLIIPKLNVDVPVAFGIDNAEKVVMDAMNHGVAHFMIPGASSFPGEIGNTIITGHSAGDIYSNNQYKFIFSGLERLENKDLIYVNYKSVRYTYAVTRKEVVEPHQVDKLSYQIDKPVLTLITCTPLGTSKYRLLVTAEQIGSSNNSVATKPQNQNLKINEPANNLPQNEPSLLENVWRFLTNQ